PPRPRGRARPHRSLPADSSARLGFPFPLLPFPSPLFDLGQQCTDIVRTASEVGLLAFSGAGSGSLPTPCVPTASSILLLWVAIEGRNEMRSRLEEDGRRHGDR